MQKAGINAIMTHGYYGDQLQAFPENDDKLLEDATSLAKYFKGTVPWLNTAENRENFLKFDAFLGNYDTYVRHKTILKNAEKRLAEGKITRDRVDRIQATVDGLKQEIVDFSKTILSITYKPPNPETIVMQVPVMVNWGQQGGGPPSPRDSGIPFTRQEAPRS
jgi:hypothetical protein